MRHLLTLAVGLCLLAALGACRTLPTAEDAAAPAPTDAAHAPTDAAPAPSDAHGAVVTLHGPDGEARSFAVEVAADGASRQRGLMGRTDLPAGTGMLFVFPADTTGAFWMKDTLVPLSIAFVDVDGRVVTVRDMQPCDADPCPRYHADGPYRFALEVPQGELDGVGSGWRLDTAQPGADGGG